MALLYCPSCMASLALLRLRHCCEDEDEGGLCLERDFPPDTAAVKVRCRYNYKGHARLVDIRMRADTLKLRS